VTEDGESRPVVELLVDERAGLERHEAQRVTTEEERWIFVRVTRVCEALAVAVQGIGFVALAGVFRGWFVSHDAVLALGALDSQAVEEGAARYGVAAEGGDL
jgi:anti-sigma-K factor RskA